MTQQQYVEKLYKSFPSFLAETWKAVGLPKPSMVQLDVAAWLRNPDDAGSKDRGVRGFRGLTKTWITIAYALWRLFRNPDEKIPFISKSEGHSKGSLYQARQWLDIVPFLFHLRPDSDRGQRDSATKFDVGPAKPDRTPSWSAYGISGQITGTRGSVIVLDDIETPENTLTREMRLRLQDRAKEINQVLVPGGDIVVLGTPHHEETIYDFMAENGFTFRSWPARYPTRSEKVPHLSPALQERLDSGKAKAGDPTWPERFDDDDLIRREAKDGHSIWLMQFQIVSNLGETLRYPLVLRDLIVFDVQRDKAPVSIAYGMTNDRGGTTRIEDIRSLGFGTDGFYSPIMFDKEWAPYTGTKMWIDPSGAGEDNTGYAIVSQLHGYLWCHDVGGLKGGYGQQALDTLATAARRYKVREVYVEDNFGQGMFQPLFEPVLQRHFLEPGDDEAYPEGWKASVETIRVTTQKETRIIENLEPVMNQHRLVISPEVAANEELQYQLTHITRARGWLAHEDELESLAMCVAQWQHAIQQDPKKAAERRRQQWLEEQVREQQRLTGMYAPEPMWADHRRRRQTV